jgi:hypothetical protein
MISDLLLFIVIPALGGLSQVQDDELKDIASVLNRLYFIPAFFSRKQKRDRKVSY